MHASKALRVRVGGVAAAGLLALACGQDRGSADSGVAPAAPPSPPADAATAAVLLSPDLGAIRARAQQAFGVLPDEVPTPDDPITEEKVVLGRMLYYESRLSKNHDISCNSCHPLDRFGVDNEPTSPGHKGQRGERNSPTVYNAALHIAQFWDGRAADVEEQAKGPILNPVEMAMPSDVDVLGVIRSIPGYAPLFAAAFPGDEDPIRYENVAKAIGAFERRLTTPGPLDAFLKGDLAALGEAQVRGLTTFLDTGCPTCHNGAAVGGGMYQKLGLVRPYATDDPGRAAVTGNEAERHFFKVPSLRNITQTAPYFHDGSIASLDDAIRTMASVQLGRDLGAAEVASIRDFLGALTGKPDPQQIARPELPASGPDTPAPDPS